MNSFELSIPIRKYVSTFSGLSTSCWKGIFINFFTFVTGDIFYFLSVYFVTELHLSVEKSGLIVGCYGVGAMLGGCIGGRLSDLFDPALAQRVGIFIQAIGFFLLIFLKSFIPLMFVTTLIGMAIYIFTTANYLFVLNQIESEELRLKAINIISMAANLALSTSALLVGVFSPYGFTPIFVLVTIVLVGEFFYLSFSNIKNITSSKKFESKKSNISINKLFHDENEKIIFIALLCVFLTGLSVSQLNSNYSLYIQYLFPDLGIKAVSILFTINAITMVFVEVPFVSMFKKINKILMVGIGCLLIGIGFLLLNYSFIFFTAILACILYTFGEMIFFSMAQLVCYQKVNQNERGRSMGNYRTVYALTQIVGPVGGGLIFAHFGWGIIWYISGILGLACYLICLYNKKYY